ncbi:uncharacterized protein PAC_18021 [Phialocephala subalpina]|uniref:Uncharacterized protein n=1 Tax=Phialocephala subalpina TaxID=576137 RepID=A0A1L7XSV1_9HELO|nr:uncharacterized protein PAC_18021 [Phialocephala subalpina]
MPTPVQHSDTTIAGVSELDWLPPPKASTHPDARRATQTNPYYSIPDYIDKGEMRWATFFGVESSVNHLLAFEGSANLDLPPVHDNVASADNFYSPATLEPCMRINDQDTVDPLDLTPPSIVQMLANLDVALYECSLKLPFPFKAGSDSVRIGTRKSKMFALDELFRLTTEFLNIFTCLSHEADQLNVSPSSTIQTESNAESTLPFFAYSQRLSKTVHSAGMEEPTRPFSPLDEATIFMIMSCHCRLTEIYVSLFKMMQACIEHSLAPRGDKDWAIILPQLQVGSITLPPVQVDINTPVSPTISSMYMLMITILSSQVWEQLADKMRVCDGISVRMGSSSVLTETVWNKITDKNDRILQTIDDTRHLLQ